MGTAYSRDPVVDRSLRHSLRDGVAYSVMTGAGETYFSVYALFLKATTAQIGLLASLPPLLASAAQFLSAWLWQRTGRRKPIMLAGALLQAVMWLPIMVLPHLFPRHAVVLFLGGVVLYYVGSNLATPVWASLMGDIVPERRRGRFFGRRTRLMSVTSFVSLVCAGLVLNYAQGRRFTYLGFMAVFAIASLARFYSVSQLRRMHDPERTPAAWAFPPLTDLVPRLRRSHFARFSLYIALLNFSVAIGSPFFTVYMLRDLHFSYLQFTAGTASYVLMQFLALNMWGRLGDVFGNRLILVVTGAVIPVLPLLWLLSGHFGYILSVQLVSGLTWAGFSLSAGNFLYDVVPGEKRAAYSSIHNALSSAGVFLGALLGGSLAIHIPHAVTVFGYRLHWHSGLWGVFVLSAAVRLTVALALSRRLKEVRTVRPLSVSGLVSRVTRFHALAGLVFGAFSLRRRPAGDALADAQGRASAAGGRMSGAADARQPEAGR